MAACSSCLYLNSEPSYVCSNKRHTKPLKVASNCVIPEQTTCLVNLSHSHRVPSALTDVSPRQAGELPHDLDARLLPRHVAAIMDGNSRWAERQGLSCKAGHEAGVKSLKEIIRLSCEWRISALTVFAFSTENWHRPEVEVAILMKLFQRVVKHELENFARENIRVRVIGDIKRLPVILGFLIKDLEEKTANNTGLKLTIAMSYSGRYDIMQACKRIATEVQQGKLMPEDITEANIERELCTSWMDEVGDPDLLIRTSGEQRLSNFLLWQLAYTELFFMDVLWPDVDELHYADALLWYQRRVRRYGRRAGP